MGEVADFDLWNLRKIYREIDHEKQKIASLALDNIITLVECINGRMQAELTKDTRQGIGELLAILLWQTSDYAECIADIAGLDIEAIREEAEDIRKQQEGRQENG